MISDEILTQAAKEYEQALLAAMPTAVAGHTFSKSFEKKMARLCRKTKHTSAYTAFKRVACAVILVALLGSTAVLSSADGPATVWGWLGIFTEKDTYDTTLRSYDFAEAPVGYTFVRSSETSVDGVVLYANASGRQLIFGYTFDPDGSSIYFIMDDHIHLQETVNGLVMDIYLSQDEEHNSGIIWSVPGEAQFWISADLDKEALIALTQKVIVKE